MRILVLQLARFGDVYQCWPTFHALRRKYPNAEIHVLVRQRFQAALVGCEGIVAHILPTADILEPVMSAGDAGAAHSQLQSFLKPIQALAFDQIINLSFSPVSSYLTDILSSSDTEVRGYTRHSDGHFHIPDDTSSYFHAQVGIGRGNRYHVTEIFASVAGCDLEAEDFNLANYCGPRHGVVVHLGASTHEKCYSPENWVKAIRAFNASAKNPVTLIGGREERGLSDTVAAQVASAHVRNLVGETQLHELFDVIGTAAVLIGADSAPIHIATLTGTPTLNLSSANVNFWETGPLAARSRVIYRENLQEIEPGVIAAEARSIVAGFEPTDPCAHKTDPLSPYVLCGLSFDNFRWNLIQALYTGTPYPTLNEKPNRLAMDRLFELSELALQQLARWPELKDRSTSAKILAQVDEMFTEVARLNPNSEPVVQWFETQRLRIPPGTDAETLERTTKAFQDLYTVTSVYHKNADIKEVAAQAISLCREVAPEMREYNMQGVSDSFQNLVSALQELARHSTKVADISWSSVLDEMNQSLASRDYIQLADFLEWKMIPALISLESGA